MYVGVRGGKSNGCVPSRYEQRREERKFFSFFLRYNFSSFLLELFASKLTRCDENLHFDPNLAQTTSSLRVFWSLLITALNPRPQTSTALVTSTFIHFLLSHLRNFDGRRPKSFPVFHNSKVFTNSSSIRVDGHIFMLLFRLLTLNILGIARSAHTHWGNEKTELK